MGFVDVDATYFENGAVVVGVGQPGMRKSRGGGFKVEGLEFEEVVDKSGGVFARGIFDCEGVAISFLRHVRF